MGPFKRHVIMAFLPHSTLSHFLIFTLQLPLCFSLNFTKKLQNERKEDFFCINCSYNVSRYIKGGKNHIFKHTWNCRHLCKYKQSILTKQWNYNILVQSLYRYFRYTSRLSLGCALSVARCNMWVSCFGCALSVARCNMWVSCESKKERLSYRKKYVKEFARGTSLFWLHTLLLCHFLLLSLPTPSPFLTYVIAEWQL